jgi:large subunit ribosomal protein L29
MTKAEDVRAKTTDELKEQLVGLRKESFNLRFRKASGQLENTTQVRRVRRDIARIKTILGERGRQVSKASKAS